MKNKTNKPKNPVSHPRLVSPLKTLDAWVVILLTLFNSIVWPLQKKKKRILEDESRFP